MCRIPNLETAIEECQRLNLSFSYIRTGKGHIKFSVSTFRNPLIISVKNDNRDRVRKDIRRLIAVNGG